MNGFHELAESGVVEPKVGEGYQKHQNDIGKNDRIFGRNIRKTARIPHPVCGSEAQHPAETVQQDQTVGVMPDGSPDIHFNDPFFKECGSYRKEE